MIPNVKGTHTKRTGDRLNTLTHMWRQCTMHNRDFIEDELSAYFIIIFTRLLRVQCLCLSVFYTQRHFAISRHRRTSYVVQCCRLWVVSQFLSRIDEKRKRGEGERMIESLVAGCQTICLLFPNHFQLSRFSTEIHNMQLTHTHAHAQWILLFRLCICAQQFVRSVRVPFLCN